MPKKQKEKAPAGPKPPKGYDRKKLEAAWALEYTYAGLARRLGISWHMAQRWVEWRDREMELEARKAAKEEEAE